MESFAKELLKEAGKQGILLAELVQQMDKDEAAVLQIVDNLSQKGQLAKIEESRDGNTTVRLVWQEEDDSGWNTLQGCPCFVCSEIDQCGAGQPITPWICNKLNRWIQEPKD